MNVSDFKFELPDELIAQQPPAERGTSRMLTLDRISGAVQDRLFRDLPEMLRAEDLLVLNDSRVVPARLLGHRTLRDGSVSSGQVEALLLEQSESVAEEWSALVRPGRHLREGARMLFGAQEGIEDRLEAEVLACGKYGERRLRFTQTHDFWRRLEKLGRMPLPPYIDRKEEATDRERYQSVFSRTAGSAAAPTAGLHFTAEMIDQLKAKGVLVEAITLHVGLGTFQPMRVSTLEEHVMHEERYSLGEQAAAAIQSARKDGRRIVAVGTTVTRTLEHCARIPGGFEPHSGRTRIFLYPGEQFRVVGGLLTNFHLPESTLLMLVSAFAGREHVLAAYAHAVRERYRFFSYGDCMFVA